jgi:hypothetical protein
LEKAQQVLAYEHSFPPWYAVGLFRHSVNQKAYLLILNKNITQPRTKKKAFPSNATFKLMGNVRPFLFNKTTGTWNALKRSVTDSQTSFILANHEPGDAHLIRIDSP